MSEARSERNDRFVCQQNGDLSSVGPGSDGREQMHLINRLDAPDDESARLSAYPEDGTHWQVDTSLWPCGCRRSISMRAASNCASTPGSRRALPANIQSVRVEAGGEASPAPVVMVAPRRMGISSGAGVRKGPATTTRRPFLVGAAEGKATCKPVAGEFFRPRSCRGHDLHMIPLVARGLPGPDDPRDPGRNLLSIREVCRGRRAS